MAEVEGKSSCNKLWGLLTTDKERAKRKQNNQKEKNNYQIKKRFLKEPLTYSCPGPGWIFLNLAAECGVVPQGRLTFPLHQGGQLPGHSAEVGRIKETQDGVRFCQSWKDIELICEGLGQSWDHRTEAYSQSVKASLTAWAWAQGREKIQHRLASQTLDN